METHDENMVIEYLIKNQKKLLYHYHRQRLDMHLCSEEGCIDHVGLIIDHIDNNPSNFLLTNLELVCPVHFHSRKNICMKLPMTKITRSFYFDSCHNLLNYDGKCANLHGHRWKLNVEIKRPCNERSGMVMDFGDLKRIVNKHIVDNLDHRHINEIIEINPTAENMLVFIWQYLEKHALLKGMSKLTLWETPDSSASINAKSLLRSNYIVSYYEDLREKDDI